MVQYGVLGPLSVTDEGTDYTPTAPKQRQLLALLLLNPNHIVATSSCIEELWDDDPPDSAGSTLQTYVLQLRRKLATVRSIGSAAAAKKILVTRSRGYMLRVAPGELDLEGLNRMAAQGRAALARHDDGCAALLFRQALALSRGEPLADVPLGPRTRAWIAGLGEQCLSIHEQRIEADLRLGMHHELIAELSRLIVAHPTHENFHAQLMVALYRSGRQTHALEVMTRLREVLSNELGLEPSRRMQSLHQAVLAGDERLDASAKWAPSPSMLDLFIESEKFSSSLPSLENCTG